jgi:hypothetical protein
MDSVSGRSSFLPPRANHFIHSQYGHGGTIMRKHIWIGVYTVMALGGCAEYQKPMTTQSISQGAYVGTVTGSKDVAGSAAHRGHQKFLLATQPGLSGRQT